MERITSLLDMAFGFAALGNLADEPLSPDGVKRLVGVALRRVGCFSKQLFGVPPVAHKVRTLAGDFRMQGGQYQSPPGIVFNCGTRHFSYTRDKKN